MNHSRRGGRVAFYIKNHYLNNHKLSFSPNIDSIFIDIFLSKSKTTLVGMLCQPLDKSRFIEYLDNSLLKEGNISNIQQCYLMDDFNVNLLSRIKMLLDKYCYDSYSQALSLVKNQWSSGYFPSIHQLIAEPTWTTKHSKTVKTVTTVKLCRKGDSGWRYWKGCASSRYMILRFMIQWCMIHT